jgi:hypothetical protein
MLGLWSVASFFKQGVISDAHVARNHVFILAALSVLMLLSNGFRVGSPQGVKYDTLTKSYDLVDVVVFCEFIYIFLSVIFYLITLTCRSAAAGFLLKKDALTAVCRMNGLFKLDLIK